MDVPTVPGSHYFNISSNIFTLCFCSLTKLHVGLDASLDKSNQTNGSISE